jgi:aquaporin Z
VSIAILNAAIWSWLRAVFFTGKPTFNGMIATTTSLPNLYCIAIETAIPRIRRDRHWMGQFARSQSMNLGKRCIAESIGTFWLVFGGCGSAVLAANFASQLDGSTVNLGIGFVGVSFAFGLTVLTMAYAIGHISGCHLNPAVSAGLVTGGRFPAKEFVPYVVAQVIGGIAGAAVLYLIASGQEGFSLAGGFASNGYGEHSPGKYSVLSCFVSEAVLTFMFLLIILGATDRRAPVGFAPIAIGLGLTLIHLIGIPVTNLSVNPARSTGPAVFVQGWAIAQLWLFWVAPIAGAVTAGVVYRSLFEGEVDEEQETKK